MIVKIFAIYDDAAGAYIPPFFKFTRALAERDFRLSVSDQDHPFSKQPGDYTLFELGEFDDEHAVFTLFDTPTRVISGHAAAVAAAMEHENAQISNGTQLREGPAP